MRTYQGTKIVNAKPMTRQQYNDLRGWVVPSDEDPSDEGYLVEYTDGGKANVPGYAGYVSWSPKGVFERAYVMLTNEVRPPHEARLIAEYDELSARVRKLDAFMGTPVWSNLTATHQWLLQEQLRHMSGYQRVLRTRIDLLAVPATSLNH